MNNPSSQLRPFLKWAGSKKQLLDPIKRCILKGLARHSYNVFVDGFLGSGAVMFMVLNDFVKEGCFRAVIANDSNRDLIVCFNSVKQNVRELLQELKRLEKEFRNASDPKAYYLNARTHFNDREDCNDLIERSALFIFLNHTCFNGLYRVNADGEFNVPYGQNHRAKIFSEEVLEADSEVLNTKDVVFQCGDFQFSPKLQHSSANKAMFYFDPPYRPLTATSSFSKYTKNDFGNQEQDRLAKYCVELCESGAGVIASNSDTSDNYYKEHYKKFNIEKVRAVRMLNANVNTRGTISEVLLSRF